MHDRAKSSCLTPDLGLRRRRGKCAGNLFRIKWVRQDLGFRDRRGKCVNNLLRIREIGQELGFRGPQQYFAQHPEKIGSLHSEFRLRDVPGKSTQRGWQTQRFWRPSSCPALVQTPRGKVIGITPPPRPLHLPSVRGLAIGLSASTLTFSNSRVGAEPTTTDRARFFLSVRHGGDSSSPHAHRLDRIPPAVIYARATDWGLGRMTERASRRLPWELRTKTGTRLLSG